MEWGSCETKTVGSVVTTRLSASDLVSLLAARHHDDVFVAECKTGSTWRGRVGDEVTEMMSPYGRNVTSPWLTGSCPFSQWLTCYVSAIVDNSHHHWYVLRIANVEKCL